jgi:excisionase family DNA binding protein
VIAGVIPADAEGAHSKMNSIILAHTISDACSIARTGRTSLYEAIRTGALRAVKRGRRTLILDDDLRSWVQSLPPVAVQTAKSNNKEKSND